MNFLKSWPGAVCQSSNSAQLGAACPFPHPPVPTPSHAHPWALSRCRCVHPRHPCAEHGVGIHCPAAKATHTSSRLTGEQLSASIPDRYSCNFLGRSLWSSEERPVQALLRNTFGPAATTYIVDIYLKVLFLYFFLNVISYVKRMLFTMQSQVLLS